MDEVIHKYVKDFYEWPEKWKGTERDLPVGQEIINVFEPFILHLIKNGYSKRTIKNHADNLWLLGGEIVRDVIAFDLYGEDIIKKTEENVDVHGGPLCKHLQTERDLNSYNGTCRKLFRYLN